MVTLPTNKLRATLATSVLVLLAALPIQTGANGYNVKAKILYDPPTQTAVIDPSLDGSTVQNALFTISGTCQLMNPQNIVSIWRSGTAIGSTTCDGTFSLEIMLTEGSNDLIARTANISDLYGPDSSPITVTLVLPPAPPSPTPTAPITTSPEPATPAQETTATNYGAGEGLSIVPTTPFSTLSGGNKVSITVTLAGGEHPYDIVLNWGDGSSDLHHVASTGSYTYSHQYQSGGSYKVHGLVRDAVGAYSEFNYAVLAPTKTPVLPTAGTSHTGIAGHHGGFPWYWIGLLFAIIGGLIILYGAYWLGFHRAVATLLIPARRRSKKTKKRKKRKAKGRRK